MNKKEIEEMAVIGCVRNPQAHTAEECAKCDFKQGQCNSYRHAEALYNAGYRKVPDGAVILTPEERDEEMKEINKTLAERDELKAENERLKEVIADQNELCWNCKKSIKEFAEKLKKRTILYNGINVKYEAITADNIDELLKEYE